MNKKASKKIRGFMCQSLEATSCMKPDSRSVILSRRSTDRTLVEHARFLSNAKYIRLAEHRGYVLPRPSPATNSISTSVGRDRHDCVKLDQNALSLSSANQVFQVVVMRVSIHCQGCAGKVKKHLSKMEGVTSFSVELESKRVTVTGHVSPAAVLESISKERGRVTSGEVKGGGEIWWAWSLMHAGEKERRGQMRRCGDLGHGSVEGGGQSEKLNLKHKGFDFNSLRILVTLGTCWACRLGKSAQRDFVKFSLKGGM